MPDDTPSLEDFMARVIEVLQDTENNLQQLAKMALLRTESQSTANRDNHHPAGEEAGHKACLHQVSRQLLTLSEQGQLVRNWLQGEGEAPPLDSWPRIRVLQSQEEERRQIARQLEDSVGQLLANTVFELASYRHLLNQDKEAAISGGLETLQAELEQGLSDFRHLIGQLEPTTLLGSFGLGGGVRRYLEQYQAKTGLETRLRINTNLGRLPLTLEIAIFRIIQEALANIHYHANASQVEVVFEEQDDMLHFSVVDNGDGLNQEKFETSQKNLGLARMLDYTELLNGNLKVFSESGYGTRVVLSMPYPVL